MFIPKTRGMIAADTMLTTRSNGYERMFWQNGRLLRQTDCAWVAQAKTLKGGIRVTEYVEGTGIVAVRPFRRQLVGGAA